METLIKILNITGGGTLWRIDDFLCAPHLTTQWLPKPDARKVYRAAAAVLKRPEFAKYEIRFCEAGETVNLRIVSPDAIAEFCEKSQQENK